MSARRSGSAKIAKTIKTISKCGQARPPGICHTVDMKRTTLEDYKERMLRVLLYIQRHLDEETPLEELARVAAFSPYHFHRVFKSIVGETLNDFIRRVRVQRAAA